MIPLYAGFIYVMTRPDGDVKIGISREPYQRLTAVRDNAADRLTIAAVWGHQHPRKVEAMAHRLLASFRTRGEWFSVSKYVAFDAISQAMLKVDRALKLSPAPPEAPLPIEPPLPKIVVSAPYDVPVIALDQDVKFLTGYARDLAEAPLAQQVQWMWAAGVREANIHVDNDPSSFTGIDYALKDCRTGDGLMAWSPRVIETLPVSVADLVAAKGAKLIYAAP